MTQIQGQGPPFEPPKSSRNNTEGPQGKQLPSNGKLSSWYAPFRFLFSIPGKIIGAISSIGEKERLINEIMQTVFKGEELKKPEGWEGNQQELLALYQFPLRKALSARSVTELRTLKNTTSELPFLKSNLIQAGMEAKPSLSNTVAAKHAYINLALVIQEPRNRTLFNSLSEKGYTPQQSAYAVNFFNQYPQLRDQILEQFDEPKTNEFLQMVMQAENGGILVENLLSSMINTLNKSVALLIGPTFSKEFQSQLETTLKNNPSIIKSFNDFIAVAEEIKAKEGSVPSEESKRLVDTQTTVFMKTAAVSSNPKDAAFMSLLTRAILTHTVPINSQLVEYTVRAFYTEPSDNRDIPYLQELVEADSPLGLRGQFSKPSKKKDSDLVDVSHIRMDITDPTTMETKAAITQLPFHGQMQPEIAKHLFKLLHTTLKTPDSFDKVFAESAPTYEELPPSLASQIPIKAEYRTKLKEIFMQFGESAQKDLGDVLTGKGATPSAIEQYRLYETNPEGAIKAARCGCIFVVKEKLSLLPIFFDDTKDIATVPEKLLEESSQALLEMSSFEGPIYLDAERKGRLQIQKQIKDVKGKNLHYLEVAFTISGEEGTSPTTRTVAYKYDSSKDLSESALQRALKSKEFEKDILLAKALFYEENAK